MFVSGNEIVVAGGHTSGFVPTKTAERLSGGKWHLMNMAYTHDNALCVPLKSGRVLLAGGHSEALGIGQTFTAEYYDPIDHSFCGFGCLYTKRSLPSGTELTNGDVVIAGNWYREDMLEVFDGKKTFAYEKKLSYDRSFPLILQISDNNAIIFGGIGTKGERVPTAVVDRLHGEPFHVPLLEKWQCLLWSSKHALESFTGDEEANRYTYLLPVRDSLGQLGVVEVCDTLFRLLPTSCPVPMVCDGDSILYTSHLMADRERQMAYICGNSLHQSSKMYVLSIAYGKENAKDGVPLQLYCTDSIPNIAHAQPMLLPDGNIVLTGGCPSDNFAPFAATYLLLVNPDADSTAWIGKGMTMADVFKYIGWALLALLPLLVLLTLYIRKQRRTAALAIPKQLENTNTPETTTEPEDVSTETTGKDNIVNISNRPVKNINNEEELIQRIRQLMESEKLFLNNELKLADLANQLGVNSRQVSDCINHCEGCSFPLFVNTYRIEHAKQILRQCPDTKIQSLYIEAGFSNETSFFRTFKAFEGVTPGDWLSQDHTS